MGHVLDEMDRRIVTLLQRDGRTPNVEIARQLGLAEGTVRKRLERLLAGGIIRIAAITDPAKLGRTTRVFIGIEADLTQMETITQRLVAIPEIQSANIVTGAYDVIIEAVLPSSDRLLSFLLDKMATIPGVKRTETCHILKVIKQPCDWIISDECLARPDARSQGTTASSGEVIPGTIVMPS